MIDDMELAHLARHINECISYSGLLV